MEKAGRSWCHKAEDAGHILFFTPSGLAVRYFLCYKNLTRHALHGANKKKEDEP